MPKCNADIHDRSRKCRNDAIIGKTKCRMHGGKSTGPPKKNKNAVKHRIYCKDFTEDEKKCLTEIDHDNQATELDELTVMALRVWNHVSILHNAKLQDGKVNADELIRFIEILNRTINSKARIKHARLMLKNSDNSEENKPLPFID